MKHLSVMVIVAGAIVAASSVCLAGFDVSHYGGIMDKGTESADQKSGKQVYATWSEGANYRVAWKSTVVLDKGSGKNSWVLGTKVDVAANGTYMILQEVRTYYTKAQWKEAYPKDDPGKLGYAPFDADGDQKADGYVSPLKNRPPVNPKTGRPESSGFTMKIGWNVADPGDPDAANAKEAIDLMGTMAGDRNVVIPSTQEIDQKAQLAQSRQHGERGIALGNNLYALSRGGIGGSSGMNGLDSPKGPGTGPVVTGGSGAGAGSGGAKGVNVTPVDTITPGAADYLKGGALGAATDKLINKGAPDLGLDQGSFGKKGGAADAKADAALNTGQLAGGLGTGPAGAGKSDAGRQQGGATAGGVQQGGQTGGTSSVGTDTTGQWDRTHQGSFGDSGFGSAGAGSGDAGSNTDTGAGAGVGDSAADAAGTGDAGVGGPAAGAGDAGAAGAAGDANAGTPGFGQGEANETGGGVTSGTGGGGLGAGGAEQEYGNSWQDEQGNTYTDYGDGTMDVTHHDQPIEWTEDGQKHTGTGDVTVGYGQNEDGSYSRTSDEGAASNVQEDNGQDRDDLDGMPVDVTTQDQGGDDGADSGGSSNSSSSGSSGDSSSSSESGGSTGSSSSGESSSSTGSSSSGESGGSTESSSSGESSSSNGSSSSGSSTSGSSGSEDDDTDDDDTDDTGDTGSSSGSMTNPYDDNPDSEGGGLPFALGGEVLRDGLRERIMGAVEYTPGTEDDGEGGRGPAPNSGLAANKALRAQLFGMVGYTPGDIDDTGTGGTGPKPNTGSVFDRIVAAIKSFLGFSDEKSAASASLTRGAASFRQMLPIGFTVGSSPGADSGGDNTGGGVTLGPDGKPVKGPTTGPNTNLGTQSGTQQQIQR